MHRNALYQVNTSPVLIKNMKNYRKNLVPYGIWTVEPKTNTCQSSTVPIPCLPPTECHHRGGGASAAETAADRQTKISVGNTCA